MASGIFASLVVGVYYTLSFYDLDLTMKHHQTMNYPVSKGSKGILIFVIVFFLLFSMLEFSLIFFTSSSPQEHQDNVRIGLIGSSIMIGMAALAVNLHLNLIHHLH